MGTMADLRGALAATLEGLAGVQESAYTLANPTPPTAEVEPAAIDYDLAMHRGLDKWMFTVRVFVGLASDIGAQKLLDTFIDPTDDQSVKTLIEADRTLGGVCDFVHVTKCSGYLAYASKHTGTMTLGAEFTVEIHVSN